jgi:hypothetical protein
MAAEISENPFAPGPGAECKRQRAMKSAAAARSDIPIPPDLFILQPCTQIASLTDLQTLGFQVYSQMTIRPQHPDTYARSL